MKIGALVLLLIAFACPEPASSQNGPARSAASMEGKTKTNRTKWEQSYQWFARAWKGGLDQLADYCQKQEQGKTSSVPNVGAPRLATR